jgi:hypothetical protein
MLERSDTVQALERRPVWLAIIKVKMSLCFNRAPRHEGVLGEWRYSSTHSLTSALDRSECSASRPGRFTISERVPGTHWIWGWVGPRAVLDTVAKRKIPSPCRDSNPRSSSPVVQRYTTELSRLLSAIMVKVKVKISLCLNWASRHEGVLGEWRYSSLTSALDWGGWSASRPGRFNPREAAPATHWIGGWVGPRAVLDAVVNRRIPSPCRESKPRTPIVQPVAQRYITEQQQQQQRRQQQQNAGTGSHTALACWTLSRSWIPLGVWFAFFCGFLTSHPRSERIPHLRNIITSLNADSITQEVKVRMESSTEKQSYWARRGTLRKI